LHGFSDDASAWTAVGRANVILDNLIAQGKARHMIIVMPLGYGAPEVLLPNSGVWRDRTITERNFNKFSEALLTEVIPRVEADYLVTKDRNSRAIAGSPWRLRIFADRPEYTGQVWLDWAFSSGGITEDFDKEFPAVDSKTTEQLHLLWIACGTDDRLMDINRRFRGWLASKNIKHVTSRRPARILDGLAAQFDGILFAAFPVIFGDEFLNCDAGSIIVVPFRAAGFIFIHSGDSEPHRLIRGKLRRLWNV